MSHHTLTRSAPGWWLAATVLVAAALLGRAAEAAPTVVELTQTGCQFLETEAADHGFATHGAADCNAINARTSAARLANGKVLRLTPGEYVFRVTNRDVPYPLGFWLRGKGLGRVTLPSVSGGGLATGASRDYPVTLAAGEYHFSCPLNPTPDYTLIVE